MSLPIGSQRVRLSYALVSLGLLLSIVFCYSAFIQVTNEYLGYLVVSYGATDIFLMAGVLALLVLQLKNGVRLPSDFFCFIYIIFVLMPFCVLFKIRGEIDDGVLIIGSFFLVFPLVVFSLTRRISYKVMFSGFLSWRWTMYALFVLLAISVWLLMSSGIPSSSFDVDSSYDRRLEGRDAFQTGAIASYIVSMVSNSVLPLLAFWSGYSRRAHMFILAIAGCLLMYFYLGVKAPFLYVVIGFVFSLAVRSGAIVHSKRLFAYAVLLAFSLFFVELMVLDYSYIGDYLLRRAFAVPPFLVSAYLEMFFNSSGYWDLVSGVLVDQPVTMVMGEYLGDPALNANTNSFIYALGSGGVGGYVLDILLVCAVFNFMDRLYIERSDPAMLWLGFLFSLLLVEQSSKTALVSSGIALVLLISFFGRYRVR